jgi:fumarate reductase subunit C
MAARIASLSMARRLASLRCRGRKAGGRLVTGCMFVVVVVVVVVVAAAITAYSGGLHGWQS